MHRVLYLSILLILLVVIPALTFCFSVLALCYWSELSIYSPWLRDVSQVIYFGISIFGYFNVTTKVPNLCKRLPMPFDSVPLVFVGFPCLLMSTYWIGRIVGDLGLVWIDLFTSWWAFLYLAVLWTCFYDKEEKRRWQHEHDRPA